jgi:hypothetical protein
VLRLCDALHHSVCPHPARPAIALVKLGITQFIGTPMQKFVDAEQIHSPFGSALAQTEQE